MNRSNLLIVLFLFIFTCIYGIPTEDINTKKLINKGNNLIEKENFEEALTVFKQILLINKKNANINFKIGFCFYNLPGKKSSALPYFRKAITNISDNYKFYKIAEKKAPIITCFFLADTYLYINEPDSALKYFIQYQEKNNGSPPIDVTDYLSACFEKKSPVFSSVQVEMDIDLNEPEKDNTEVEVTDLVYSEEIEKEIEQISRMKTSQAVEEMNNMNIEKAIGIMGELETGKAVEILNGMELEKSVNLMEGLQVDKASNLINEMEIEKAIIIVKDMDASKAGAVLNAIEVEKATEIVGGLQDGLDDLNSSNKADVIELIKSYFVGQISKRKLIIFKTIYFDFNSSELLLLSKNELMILIEFMNENPDIKIEVVGHTDNIGNWDINIEVSNSRAYVVYDFLRKNKITRDRIIYYGKGPASTIATNETDFGRQLNRRVEVILLQ